MKTWASSIPQLFYFTTRLSMPPTNVSAALVQPFAMSELNLPREACTSLCKESMPAIPTPALDAFPPERGSAGLTLASSSSSSSASSSASSSSFWLAASELAMWNLGAQGLLNVGLLFTEASRASFLTQTSVVLTPLVAMVGGDKVGKNVWFGCLLALIGVVTLASAESSAAAAAAAGTLGGINIGDAFCLAGALSWSMYIFRLTCIMEKGGDSVRIQAWKTIILGGLYGLWALADAVKAVGAGQTVSSLWPGAGSLTAWIILLFSAVGPGAIADVMQARAQEKVKASQANVILSAEPLWAALFGLVLLGEKLPMVGVAGGGVIVLASLFASGVIQLFREEEAK
mmetsp:Transcript_4452/g.16250  ORF Transcript_4452/g.16250 Transcript_4452/m.16250 type:complete len:344 (+) Transcript_4452:816-1847(+)